MEELFNINVRYLAAIKIQQYIIDLIVFGIVLRNGAECY